MSLPLDHLLELPPPRSSTTEAKKVRDPWNKLWQLREDGHRYLWLLGEQGFAGFGYCFATWEQLIAEIAVPALKRLQDSCGFYWVIDAGCNPTPKP